MTFVEARKKISILIICTGVTLFVLYSFSASDIVIIRPLPTNDANVIRKWPSPKKTVISWKTSFANLTKSETAFSSTVSTKSSQETSTSTSSQAESTTESLLHKARTIEDKLEAALNKAQEKEYTIIVWDPPFGSRGGKKVQSAKCGKCAITYDRSKWQDPDTKALVFHFKELQMSNWPKERRSDQLYAWWDMESSSTVKRIYGQSLSQFDSVLNLTMTYRRDSDVYAAYGLASDYWKEYQNSASGNAMKDIDDSVANKKKLAIWIVSNCGYTIGAKNRMTYINKLVNAGFDLDRRGGCFRQNGAVPNKEIIKNYKFYFSFENGYHCKDYITEKLFENGLHMGAVPVVWGAPKSDYEAVVPPGSCVYADDFESPEKLAEYLNYLDKNSTAYKQYFMWRTMKKEEMPQHDRTSSFCNLCRILHGINVDNIYKPSSSDSIPMFGYPDHPRIVTSLSKWFYEMENKDCL